MLPIIEIDVYLADTGLENYEIAIYIMRKLAVQEHDIPFADVLAKSILDDYKNLKDWVKEWIVHTICQPDESRKFTSRYIEMKYRMQVEPYPEVDKFGHHDIDEEGIVKSLLPHIKSLYEDPFKNICEQK